MRGPSAVPRRKRVFRPRVVDVAVGTEPRRGVCTVRGAKLSVRLRERKVTGALRATAMCDLVTDRAKHGPVIVGLLHNSVVSVAECL